MKWASTIQYSSLSNCFILHTQMAYMIFRVGIPQGGSHLKEPSWSCRQVLHKSSWLYTLFFTCQLWCLNPFMTSLSLATLSCSGPLHVLFPTFSLSLWSCRGLEDPSLLDFGNISWILFPFFLFFVGGIAWLLFGVCLDVILSIPKKLVKWKFSNTLYMIPCSVSTWEYYITICLSLTSLAPPFNLHISTMVPLWWPLQVIFIYVRDLITLKIAPC